MGVLVLDTGQTFSVSYPLVQDYNGDGKTDFARTQYPDNTRLEINFLAVIAGEAHLNQPGIFGKIGDTTGDGKADVFTFSPTNNLATIKTYGTNTRNTIQFGGRRATISCRRITTATVKPILRFGAAAHRKAIFGFTAVSSAFLVCLGVL